MYLLKLIDSINNIFMKIAAVLLGLTTLLILLEILMWNTMEKSLLITDEYSAYGLAAMVFLGAGFTLRNDGHIKISLFVNLFNRKIANIITFISVLSATVFSSILVYYLFIMVSETYSYQSTSGTISATKLWIPQTIMLAGAIGFLLQIFAETIRAFLNINNRENEGA